MLLKRALPAHRDSPGSLNSQGRMEVSYWKTTGSYAGNSPMSVPRMLVSGKKEAGPRAWPGVPVIPEPPVSKAIEDSSRIWWMPLTRDALLCCRAVRGERPFN